MGDIVHALPVAYDIKKHYPDCELSWVVEESFTDIPKLSPFVDKLVVTAFRRWRKNIFSSSVRGEILAVRRALAEAKYDIVIDARIDPHGGCRTMGRGRECGLFQGKHQGAVGGALLQPYAPGFEQIGAGGSLSHHGCAGLGLSY